MTDKSLAELYMMSGEFSDHNDFMNKLTNALAKGNKVVQLKNKNIKDGSEYLALAAIAESICKQFHATLLLATSVDVFKQTNADGLHLNSQVLFEYVKRPVSSQQLLSVSCHNLEEMQQAEAAAAAKYFGSAWTKVYVPEPPIEWPKT